MTTDSPPGSAPARASGSRPLTLLVAAIAGLAVGGYLGYQAGFVASRGGLAGIGAIFVWFMVAGLALLLGVVGAILHAVHVSPAWSRGLLICAAGVVAGAVGGSLAVPTFGLGYREPVTREASGRASLELDGQPGFVAFDDGAVDCGSVPDGDAVGGVTALELGELDGGTVRASFSPGGAIEVFIDGADTEPETQPFWALGGSTEFALDADGRGGRVTFVGLALTSPAPGWPEQLDGRITWRCDPWRDPDATPPPQAGGELGLELPGEALRLDGPVSAPCDYEDDGSVQGITTNGGFLLNDWPISVVLSLSGSARVGGEVQLEIVGVGKDPPPGERFMPAWTGFAIVEELGDGQRTGSIRFEDLPPGADPSMGQPPAGWPRTLTGTIRWACP